MFIKIIFKGFYIFICIDRCNLYYICLNNCVLQTFFLNRDDDYLLLLLLY